MNRTINLLTRYDLTIEEWELLELTGITNGCWGKGWFSFSKVLDRIESVPHCNPKKFKQFKRDLRQLCLEHDLDFARGGWLINFFKVNLIFVNKVIKLAHWVNNKQILKWAKRILLIGLGTVGMKYYRWSFKKLSVEDIFNNIETYA